MPRDGAVTLLDLKAKGVERLAIACRLCDRHGSYRIDQALDRCGDAKLTDMLLELTADCPRGKGADIMDRCQAFYPDLRVA